MLVSIDAGQIEWRAAVELSGDKVGLEELAENKDMHTINQAAFNLPSRHVAKIYLFRTIFRGTGFSFAHDPQFSHVSSSPKFWDNINQLFYEKYYGLNAWHHKLAQIVSTGRSIITPFGREWVIEMARDRHGELKIPWTTLANYPVQGTSADVMMLVRLELRRRLQAAKIPCVWVSTVHDSIVLDLPNSEDIQQVTNIAYDVFADLPKLILQIFKYEWKAPMTCEVVAGPNMQDMVEYKKIP